MPARLLFARESAMMGMASKTDDPALQYPTLYHTMLRRHAQAEALRRHAGALSAAVSPP